MKSIKILLLIILLMPISVYAKRGCCSHHGGVVGCSSGGRQICADGTFSPSCTCTPIRTDVYGCTDSRARNYNPRATINNGTCVYDVLGCMDSSAENYNKNATVDDGSCSYPSKTETSNGEIIGDLLTVGLAVGGYQAIKKSKKK